LRASGHRGPANATVPVYALVNANANADVHVYVVVNVHATATVGRSRKGAPRFKGVEKMADKVITKIMWVVIGALFFSAYPILWFMVAGLMVLLALGAIVASIMDDDLRRWGL
jgi:hypothetical protein